MGFFDLSRTNLTQRKAIMSVALALVAVALSLMVYDWWDYTDAERYEVAMDKAASGSAQRLAIQGIRDEKVAFDVVLNAKERFSKKEAIERISASNLKTYTKQFYQDKRLIDRGTVPVIFLKINDPALFATFFRHHCQDIDTFTTEGWWDKEGLLPRERDDIIELMTHCPKFCYLIAYHSKDQEIRKRFVLGELCEWSERGAWAMMDKIDDPELLYEILKQSRSRSVRLDAEKKLAKLTDPKRIEKVVIESSKASLLVKQLIDKLPTQSILTVVERSASDEVRHYASGELFRSRRFHKLTDMQAIMLTKHTDEKCAELVYKTLEYKPEMLRVLALTCPHKYVCIKAVKRLVILELQPMEAQLEGLPFDKRMALYKRIPDKRRYSIFKSIQLEPAIRDKFGELSYSEQRTIRIHQYVPTGTRVKTADDMKSALRIATKLRAEEVCIEIKDSQGRILSKRTFKAQPKKTEEFVPGRDKLLPAPVNWDEVRKDLLETLDASERQKVRKALDHNRKKYDYLERCLW